MRKSIGIIILAMGLALIAAAHGSSAAGQTRSKQGATSRDLANHGSPTFSHDIAPILYQNCASCHHPGGPAPFSLLTYEDAKRHAAKIAEVTRRRYMPPWLPEHGYGSFVGELRLTEAQIALIGEWAAAGTLEGTAVDAPTPPKFPEDWQLGPPDMILEAPRSITVPATGPDVFWNFIFSPQLNTRRYVRAIEIRPGGAQFVHHANLIVDRERSARRQEKEPGAGVPGMDLKIMRTTFDFDSHFLFWKPGSTPWQEPDGLAWELDPGNDLVLNAHMRTSGKPREVRPSIGLYFTDKPPNRFPMLIQLEDDQDLDIPAGTQDFVIHDQFRLPVDVHVLAVYPHAHYLGHLLEGYATLPNGERKWLIRIPNWDPSWQSVYHYRDPVYLPKGSLISMRFHYDNSSASPRNPHRPPRRVRGGNMAMDEMGHLWLQVLPAGPGDYRREIEQALMEHRLDKDPDNVQARVMLGALMLSRLNPAAAAAVLQEAVRLDPKQSRAHNLYGAALTALGRLPEAKEQFEAAISEEPGYVNARYNLAKTLVKMGEFDQAQAEFRQVVSAVPKDAQAHSDLGELLMRMGNPTGALEQFQTALSLDPSLAVARHNRDLLRGSTGH
jgi:mono/diheme cytochrome c family protein/predicted negative regulator of RcsB-dependent stress response